MTRKLSPLEKAANKVARTYAELACYDGDDLGEYERLAQRWHEAVDTFLALEEQDHVDSLRVMRGL